MPYKGHSAQAVGTICSAPRDEPPARLGAAYDPHGMPDPRPSLRGRTVLVIDESLSDEPLWIGQLRHLFSVTTIASLAGATVAISGQDVAAVVLVLTGAERRARALVSALRRHRALERTAVFVITPELAMVAAELVGIADVEIVDPAQAEYDLSLQVGAAASRMSSRPAPRRLSSMLPQGGDLIASIIPPAQNPAQRMLVRFTQDCAERGQRGLLLCERLSARDTTPAERHRAAEDLKSLLTFIRADALVLSQSELADVLALAEQVLARLNTTKGQLVVPRGVVGLLASVVELGQGGVENLHRFDAELHRIRLESAIDR